jgi:hypothetical protein
MDYDYSRWNRLSDDEVWALSVRESYNQQLEDGAFEAIFAEVDRWAMPGGNCLDELGKLGLQLAVYKHGTYIEPESKYPRYPNALMRDAEGEAA